MDQNNPLEWRGCEMVDRDGDKIGTIEEIYLDADTRRPEWAVVKTGLFGRGHKFVPLKGADREGDYVRARYDKGQVKDAPDLDLLDGDLSVDEEQRLYEYYGIDSVSEVGQPAGVGQHRGVSQEAPVGQEGEVAEQGTVAQGGGVRRVRLVRYVLEEVPVDTGTTGTREGNQ